MATIEKRVEQLEKVEGEDSFHAVILDEHGRFEHHGEQFTPEDFRERFPKVELIAVTIIDSGGSQ